MDPNLPANLPLLDLLKQALSGLLLIPVLWYAIKDIKRQLSADRKAMDRGFLALNNRMNAVELSVAADATKHDVRHLKTDVERHDTKLEALTVAAHATDRQLAAIWSKIGDRPEDIKRRGDT